MFMRIAEQKPIIFFALLVSLVSCSSSSPPKSEERLDGVMADALASYDAPGMILGVWGPQITYLKAAGVADRATNEPMNVAMRYRIGSQTKVFTATAVLQLVDEGKVSLDDPISRFVTGVPSGDIITLRMLLSNSSGLFNYSTLPPFDLYPIAPYTPQALLDMAFAQEPDFAPGEGWRYSNTNFVLLGLVIEAVEGKKAEQAIAERLAIPHGLAHTTFPTTALLEGEHSHGYLPINGALTDVTVQDISWAWTAGGMVGDIYDMKRWIELVVGGGLISETAQAERMSWWLSLGSPPGWPEGTEAGYGLSLIKVGGYVGHDGALPGFITGSFVNAATGVTVSMMLNVQPDDGAATYKILAKIAAILGQ